VSLPLGPHWQCTAEVDGKMVKTVNPWLTPREAELHRKQISTDCSLRSLLAELREVAEATMAFIFGGEVRIYLRPWRPPERGLQLRFRRSGRRPIRS